MKFFLSKYCAVETATLPSTQGGAFNSETFQQRAQTEVGGLFDFEQTGNHPAAHAALRQLRLDFAESFDYTADGMAVWLKKFQKDYGSWDLFAHSMAYATLDPEHQRIVLFTSGKLRIWRVRMGENPKPIQTNGVIGFESTQIGDIWLITTESEKDNPRQKNFKDFVYDYAIRLNLNQVNKKNFYILSIDNQIDTNVEDSIPNKDERISKGVLAIVNQRIKAGQPFIIFENLLKSLSTHVVVGKEVTDLLAKNAPLVDIKPPVNEPQPPVVPPKPPVIPPNPPKQEVDNTGKPIQLRPYIIRAIALALGYLLAYTVRDWLALQSQEREIVVPPAPISPKRGDSFKIPSKLPPLSDEESSSKPDSVKIPRVLHTTPSNPPSEPPIAPMPKPITPAPQPIKTEAQTHLKNALDLFNDAKLSIEKNPFNLNKALLELHLSEQNGLDAKTYLEKSNEITDFKSRILGQLKKEAATLSSEAEPLKEKGEHNKDEAIREKAAQIFEKAKAKLELEKKIQPSDDLDKRLKKVEQSIKFCRDRS